MGESGYRPRIQKLLGTLAGTRFAGWLGVKRDKAPFEGGLAAPGEDTWMPRACSTVALQFKKIGNASELQRPRGIPSLPPQRLL